MAVKSGRATGYKTPKAAAGGTAKKSNGYVCSGYKK
jgi:hypothetical protein